MIRACLSAGVLTILAAPVSAQVGLAAAPRSVSLLATRQSSVTVTLRADGVVTTEWNVDPAQPLAMTLGAFVDRPVRVLSPVPAGGAKALGRSLGSLTAGAPAVMVLFSQPIVATNAHSGRRDQVPGRGLPPGILTLVVTTQ